MPSKTKLLRKPAAPRFLFQLSHVYSLREGTSTGIFAHASKPGACLLNFPKMEMGKYPKIQVWEQDSESNYLSRPETFLAWS